MSARLKAAVPALVVALAGSQAAAGALDRSGQPITPLFEPGGYVELTFGSVSPDVSGRQVLPLGGFPPGSESGQMLGDFTNLGLAIKRDFGERFSAALIFDQPYGADTSYPDDRAYFLAGARTELDSKALTAIVRARLARGFSVHGGLRYQALDGDVQIPFVAGYEANADRDEAFGYLVGVAYERPDIALRVSLTYTSEVDHEFATAETVFAPVGPGGAPVPVTTQSITEVEFPQSLALEFQTGIAPDTLLFGGIRWTEWGDFTLDPVVYREATGGSLLFYTDDVYTYSLGLGRRFTERFSGAVQLGYEDGFDGLVTNLAPVSGVRSIGVAGTYDLGAFEVTGAVRYSDIGDAETNVGGVQGAEFEDNDAVLYALQVAYRF